MRGHQVFDAFGRGIESAGQGQDAGIRWYLDAGRKIIVAEFQDGPAQTILVADKGPDPERDQQAHQPVIEPGNQARVQALLPGLGYRTNGQQPACTGNGFVMDGQLAAVIQGDDVTAGIGLQSGKLIAGMQAHRHTNSLAECTLACFKGGQDIGCSVQQGLNQGELGTECVGSRLVGPTDQRQIQHQGDLDDAAGQHDRSAQEGVTGGGFLAHGWQPESVV